MTLKKSKRLSNRWFQRSSWALVQHFSSRFNKQWFLTF